MDDDIISDKTSGQNVHIPIIPVIEPRKIPLIENYMGQQIKK